jgi:hypothetical protein
MGFAMQAVIEGYRGLSLVIGLNLDRIIALGSVFAGLLVGAFIGTAILQPVQQ